MSSRLLGSDVLVQKTVIQWDSGCDNPTKTTWVLNVGRTVAYWERRCKTTKTKHFFCLFLHNTRRALVLLYSSAAHKDMKPPGNNHGAPRKLQQTAKKAVKTPAGVSVPITMFTCLSNPRRFNLSEPGYCVSERDSLVIKAVLSHRDYRLAAAAVEYSCPCEHAGCRGSVGGGGDMTPLKQRVASPRATNCFDFVCVAMQLNIDSFPPAD